MNATTSDRHCGTKPAASNTHEVDVRGRGVAAARLLSLAPRHHPTDPEAPRASTPPRAAGPVIGFGPLLPIWSSTPQRLDLSVIPAVRLPIQRSAGRIAWPHVAVEAIITA